MTDYAIDPELLPWLAMLPDVDLADLERSRQLMVEVFAQQPDKELPEGVEVRDVVIPGPGTDITVRVVIPTAVPAPRPGYLVIHGGGFVIGGAETIMTPILAEIAAATGAVVVSPDYRVAPEDPFPAGLEDCYATLEWLVAQADELGVDVGRIGIGGDSAGGGLAAATALLARDRSGPALCYQLLNVPELDDRLETQSMREFDDTPLWNRPNAVLSWKHYLSGATELDGGDGLPYAAPSRMEDLSGLPPAFVAVCEFDPLRDEGIEYARRLLADGVSTELHHYPGTFHGSAIVEDAAVSRRMWADHLDALRRGLASTP
jgi:acetyl esterase